MLIPSTWIQNLIDSRQDYQKQNIDDVASKWAGNQLVQGPILALPYRKVITENNSAGKAITHPVTKILYVLPQNLHFDAGIKTESFYQSVHDAVVYTSKVSASGNFNQADWVGQDIDPTTVLYDKARLIFSISDSKKAYGITRKLTINGQQYNVEPEQGNQNSPLANAFTVNFTFPKDKGITFGFVLSLKGSDQLNFLDIGQTTTVNVISDWNHPDFNGRYLPDARERKG